ncbi:MAG: TfoX/Sxy family protein [Oscillospiraceae bacterium]|nr:TfoX/Sxy family protein [Oscillospiraceae bacterium]
MASDRNYLDFILEQLNGLENISCRAMMGEFILYYRGKIIGGIYDNRLLVKPVPSAVRLMPDAPRGLPYEGAKPMLLVEEVDDAEFLQTLFRTMAEELPEQKKRKSKS